MLDASPAKSPVKSGRESPMMDSGEMQVSPVGKGVGIFSLEGSPTLIGQMEEPGRDPKLQFVSPSGEEFEALQWQLRARMDEGQGEAIYEVGIGGGCSSSGLSQEDLSASLATVQSLATACGADMMVLRQRPGEVGSTAECLIRRKVEEDDFLEVR